MLILKNINPSGMIIAYINHWRNYQSKPVFLKDLSLTRTFRIGGIAFLRHKGLMLWLV